MNEEEKETIKYFYNLRALIDEKNMLYDEGTGKEYGKEKVRQITIILNLIVKLQKENKELKDFKKQVAEIESTNFIKYKNYISKQEVKDKIEEEIKYHEKNILDIENITMLRSKTAKEEAEIEFNKYAIVVLNKILQELIEESEEK